MMSRLTARPWRREWSDSAPLAGVGSVTMHCRGGVRRVTLDGRIEEILLNHRYATHVRSTSRNGAEPPDAVACRLVADLFWLTSPSSI